MKTKKQLKQTISDLQQINNSLANENLRLIEQIASYNGGKEKGCKVGKYCRACKHNVIVGQNCYCVFGECENFDKDPNYPRETFVFNA